MRCGLCPVQSLDLGMRQSTEKQEISHIYILLGTSHCEFLKDTQALGDLSTLAPESGRLGPYPSITSCC